MLNEEKNLKTYYSVREVSEMFGVSESTLRYWETEFPNLKPRMVQSSRVRMYSAKDLEDIRKIYNLVKVRGFKLAAARKMLLANPSGVDRTADMIDKLTSIKKELLQIKAALDKIV